jgi:DNA-binding PadR family transcriptional regulator
MATSNELRFLRSYLGGPRIWDAAVLQPDVHSLHEQGLIEPHPDTGRPGVYQITQLGREALEGDSLHDER